VFPSLWCEESLEVCSDKIRLQEQELGVIPRDDVMRRTMGEQWKSDGNGTIHGTESNNTIDIHSKALAIL
jgi:hypothetical protein